MAQKSPSRQLIFWIVVALAIAILPWIVLAM